MPPGGKSVHENFTPPCTSKFNFQAPFKFQNLNFQAPPPNSIFVPPDFPAQAVPDLLKRYILLFVCVLLACLFVCLYVFLFAVPDLLKRYILLFLLDCLIVCSTLVEKVNLVLIVCSWCSCFSAQMLLICLFV